MSGLNNQCIVVTGGAGYIGSVVVEQLISNGARVVVFDNLSWGHRAAVHPEAVFVEGDLANRSEIDRVLDEHRPDAVMHFAANTLVGESMEDPCRYLGENVRNSMNLLESMVQRDVRRFIFSSTANLFGAPESMPITEAESIQPGSPYGESKFIIERALHWFDRIYGLRYAALRYFNAAGATDERGEDHTPETHLIPIVLEVAQGRRERVTIFGDDYETPDGTCVRDYIHIADLAQAHILALPALEKGSRVYNLGNGRGFSVKDIVETVREISGHPVPATIGPRRPGDPPILVAGSQKIREELGWHPRFGELKEIIESAWKWAGKHPNGYDDK